MSGTKDIAAVDLFCGVGGLTYGLETAGISVRLGVDIESACEHPIEKNTKARFLKADVASLDPSIVASALQGGDVSLLAGCAPCQPFSTYARGAKREGVSRRGRGGRDDWKLVERFGTFVRETEPDLVTMENVPPLERQPVFEQLLADLEGYSVDYRIIECQTIGLPQTRKRLVLIASKLGPIRIPEFDMERSTVWDTIGDLPEISAGGADPNDRLHRASKLSKVNLERIRASIPGGTWRDWPDALRAACHERETGATYPSVYGRMEWRGPAPTITTQCFGYGNGRFGHPKQDRAISLREAAMLQGFPKGYSFIPEDESVSFAKLGRLIGNAVPVTLAEAIGRILLEHVEAL
ncbi:DNA cytosine methyltransferase [Mesorhizobium sp. ISC15]|uniref:DNA cytosine methyltransferase n=1 Tax=Mesorhizobium sp. ISC15 TaxID=3076429 RepID=UPI00301DC6DD